MGCVIKVESDLPFLPGCPGDGEFVIVGNAVGGRDVNGKNTIGYGLRTWLNLKQCIWSQILGSGTVMFTGAQLNGLNEFFPSSGNPWVGFNLIVYYQGFGYLTYNPLAPTYPSSTWQPVVSGGGITGIQILIPASFSASDIFLVIPNGPIVF